MGSCLWLYISQNVFQLPLRNHDAYTNLQLSHHWSVYEESINQSMLKRFETFETCFFQSVYNGIQNLSTNLLWWHSDGVGVILRKMF